ncbi:MAG: ThiF family adenylyltransferase [Saprospiraceae bacterium]|nr:ThiF family adenylyltransferase [Saprospiraceae bacterium]
MDDRYSRHDLIPGWKQATLQAATVVIAGLGAVGNEVARSLAMAGVGKLVLCDFDTISYSNLSRCILFRQNDVGRFKVEVAAERLIELNPSVVIDARQGYFARVLGLAELQEASLLIACVDNLNARLDVTGRCNLVRSPYLDIGTHPWGGEVRLYTDPEAACYACSLPPDRLQADTQASCRAPEEEVAVGAAIHTTALAAAWGTSFALRFLLRLSCPAGIFRFNAITGATDLVSVHRNPDCPLHMPIGNVQQIAVSNRHTIQELLSELSPDSRVWLWNAVWETVYCSACAYKKAIWNAEKIFDICPECGGDVQYTHTQHLEDIPGHLRLLEIGIPEREILGVETAEGFTWIALSGPFDTTAHRR